MGPGIAASLASGGVRSTIVSRTEEGAARGLEEARKCLLFLVKVGLASAAEAECAVRLLQGSSNLEGSLVSADLVVESGPEDLAFKTAFFVQLDALMHPEAVLASNTSGLSITAIASQCLHPERVLVTHFWNPPHLMPLVEIVRGKLTANWVAEAVRELLAACGKTPVIVKKDRPGQIGNRLQMALFREAANMVAEGIATADDIDTVAKNGFGLRMPEYGILEHQDLVGLDLGSSVLEYVARDLYNEPRAPEYLRGLVRRGQMGAKTGKGFYDWSIKSASAVRTRRDEFLVGVLRERARKRERLSGGPTL